MDDTERFATKDDLKALEEKFFDWLEGHSKDLQRVEDNVFRFGARVSKLSGLVDELRFSIPLDVLEKRLRFVYPDETGEVAKQHVEETMKDREAQLLNWSFLDKADLLGGVEAKQDVSNKSKESDDEQVVHF